MVDIYLITNEINNKKYVGISSKGYADRFKKHLYCSNKKDWILSRAIRKYGKDNFKVELIDKVETWKDALALERHYIKEYNTFKDDGEGYNMTRGGEGTLGYRFSDEAKQRMSKMRIGSNNGNYGNRGSKNPLYGRKHSEEWKRKIGQGNKGKIISKEQREILRELRLGTTLSEETKKKVGEASKRNWENEEYRNKMSNLMKGENNPMYGKAHSEETRKKISETKKGKKINEETRRKMIESRNKAIIQLNLDGEFINEWDSIKTASIKLNIDRSGISKVCRDKLKTAGGYKWMYADEYEKRCA